MSEIVNPYSFHTAFFNGADKASVDRGFRIVDADVLDENTGREVDKNVLCPKCGKAMKAVKMKDGTTKSAEAFLKEYGKCSACVKLEKANGKPD